MNDFTPVSALIGGALVGLAASLFLHSHGKVAGISGIYGALLRRGSDGDRSVPLMFVVGLVLAGAAFRWLAPDVFAGTWRAPAPVTLVAGVLVGIGTRLGSGCTSGHGVCGVARLSLRSLTATGAFMASGAATVFVVRQLLGGLR